MPTRTLLKTATLGLGGNIGDVVDTLQKALVRLHGIDGIEIVQVSPLYKTPPWGITSQNWFVNGCVEVATTLLPEQLLENCQAIENALHRKRTLRWGPRTIDIDILTFSGFASEDEHLSIPHPRMLARAFVLVPLADIVPDLLILGKPVSHWCDAVDQTGIERLDTELSVKP